MTVFVICACTILSDNDVALVDLYSSGTPKQLIKPWNHLLSICREMWNIQCPQENRKYAMLRLFLLSYNGKFQGFGMKAQYKTHIIRYQTFYGYSVKNILKMVDFKLFFFTKNVIEERTNYCKFLIPISNFFLSNFVSTDMPGANCKSNIWIFIMRTKIIVLIVGRKALRLTYLVTFKFRGTHFWCNCKGNLNSKILNNDTKNNNYILQCWYMITKWISDISILG